MKRIIVILCALILIGIGRTEASIGTPDVTTLSWLNVPVTCLDTVAGVQRIPDSAHVVVFFGNSPNDLAYAARDATAGAGAVWIDSVRYAGRTVYYFWDQIADIDADSGAGFYSGVVSLFTQGYPTDNYFSFNLVDTTAQEYGSLNYYYRLSPTTPGRTLDVTANGEAGIDLDNASGTLDVGEVGDNFITAAKIADDAIDYATFAATAPTAWWNEGKTGYTLTTQNWATVGAAMTLQGDSLKTLMGVLDAMQVGTGWGNAWMQYLMPFGTANKDSIPIFSDTTKTTQVGTIYFYHTGAIIDSLKTRIWQ